MTARAALLIARDALHELRRCMCSAFPDRYRCIRCRALQAVEAALAEHTDAPSYSQPTSTEAEWRDHAAP